MNEDNALHIAIIPDGNRRWAKQRSLLPWKGHEQSAQTFEDLITYCRDQTNVRTLTIWVFSTENWKRSTEEVEKLMRMFEKYLRKELPSFHKNETRLVHSGRRDRLSESLLTTLDDVVSQTAEHEKFTLHVALDYGGKDEVLRAIKKLHDAENVTDEELRSCLDQPSLPDIDLIIRTSGEHRTSNFFLWQSAYSEWYFTEKLFPDFSPNDLQDALDEFAERQRRYGN